MRGARPAAARDAGRVRLLGLVLMPRVSPSPSSVAAAAIGVRRPPAAL
eukprot:CAMPEP_0176098698 /NCGR_PEP_ID=MMETSP0120_2-20121206/49488_1 /TAXON_ID=160619 /ORGANISM="Kryptoperidinium foliaceum, Strain CCMP 1326" /LENGTH=47 /DNA_ID= /DNA_START= /DNA_END= /DNA_ORIENTATION=